MRCYILDPNPLNLREKLESVSSLQMVFYCARGGAYGKSVSQPVLPILMWVLWGFVNFWASFRKSWSVCGCEFSA